MSQEKQHAVLYAVNSDRRARDWLNISIESLRKNSDNRLRIFVASDSKFEKDGCEWIDARRYIDCFGLDRIRSVRKIGLTPSPMQMFRICAHAIEEVCEIEKILYLDIDTEIVSQDICDIFSIKSDSDVVALFENSPHGNDSTKICLSDKELIEEMDEKTVKRLRGGGYFNSGVMLMNLDEMRSRLPDWEDRIGHVVDLAIRHHRIVVDQDIINVVWTADPLPKRFNVIKGVVFGCKDPVAIHYAGIEKYNCSAYPPRWASWPNV